MKKVFVRGMKGEKCVRNVRKALSNLEISNIEVNEKDQIVTYDGDISVLDVTNKIEDQGCDIVKVKQKEE